MLWPSHPPEKLRELRLRALLTQQDVAEQVGITPWQLSRIEHHHHRPRPRGYSTLRRLLTLYGIQIRSLEQRDRTWETGKEQMSTPGENGGPKAKQLLPIDAQAARLRSDAFHRK
jgi:transcriptional regulator with XRE-family HTH domain